jgi:hypothetical protein
VYFPGVDFTEFNKSAKMLIEDDIQADFDAGYRGIVALPNEAKMGVYLAYKYYLVLFQKIKNLPPNLIQEKRIRVPDFQKMLLLAQTIIKYKLGRL